MHKGTKNKKKNNQMKFITLVIFSTLLSTATAECDDNLASEAVVEFLTTETKGSQVCNELLLLQTKIADLGCCYEYQKYACQDIVQHLAKIERMYTFYVGCEFPTCQCKSSEKFSQQSHDPGMASSTTFIIVWALSICLLLFILTA